MSSRAKVRRFVVSCVIAVLAAIALIAATNFPYDVDTPLSAADLEKSRKYYAEAYSKGTPSEEQSASDYESRYIKIATAAAESQHIEQQVSEFAAKYGLGNKPVLDIGSGRGYLQDVVENYTGLDISSSVSRFYHKKFVLGSATAMPFPDNSFGGGWSIWVLEHVPNPEQALVEIRRVMSNDAVLFLYPAWNSNAWAAEGYSVRPYSDFDLKGKLVKASVPIRASVAYRGFARVPNRIVRDVASLFGPTRLHYRRLQPSYKEYWEPDSDAVNDIDRNEVMLWFRSRGDECLNCEGRSGSPFMQGLVPLVIRVHK
jgi:Methylase involved in ubiquinone/menaquinone biosynthesis